MYSANVFLGVGRNTVPLRVVVFGINILNNTPRNSYLDNNFPEQLKQIKWINFYNFQFFYVILLQRRSFYWWCKQGRVLNPIALAIIGRPIFRLVFNDTNQLINLLLAPPFSNVVIFHITLILMIN